MNGVEAAAALLVDAVFGEPPEPLHPVVWMGSVISIVESQALVLETPMGRRFIGAVLAAGLPSVTFLLLHAALRYVPPFSRTLVSVALLSTAFSMRGLARSAEAVRKELDSEDLPAARQRVGGIVGRDTAELTGSEVSRAVVESVAENTSDGIVAPMFYGLFFGAPGALAYKAVNTLDSMVGYPDGPYGEFGWASARADDLANLIPARLTAVAAALVSGRPLISIKTAHSFGPLTRSPNAGWPEAAFAGALGVRLGGSNRYGGIWREGPVFGVDRHPGISDIGRAVSLMRRVCLLFAGLSLGVSLIARWARRG